MRHELHPHTTTINKAQKIQSKKAKNEALVWLTTTFPQAFDTTLRIRPLKTGIIEDILNYTDKAGPLGISRSKIREAVVLFTRRLDYLICLKTRERRIDLEGNPVEPVTEDEAERASVKIRKRIEKSARNMNKTTPKSPIKPIKQANKLTDHSVYASIISDDYLDPHHITRRPSIQYSQ